MKLNYYARIKEDNVCIEIVSTPKNLKGVKGYVSIPDYNETLLYRKWNESIGWSQERYEPEIDAVIQDRLESLEVENTVLGGQVGDLNDNIALLEGTIAELTTVIAAVMGGM